MQLNLHVPKGRERLLGRLERTAHRLGRPKNQVVLDAIERYLDEHDGGRQRRFDPADLPVFDMGAMVPFRRADLYGDDEDDD